MNFKILIAEPEDFTSEALKLLESFAEVTLRDSGSEQLKQAFANFDVIWIRLRSTITAEIIGKAPRCKVIATATTGLDHIDLWYCKTQQIKVISLKGESEFLKEVRATAEHTLGLSLALIRHVAKAHLSVVDGAWNRDLFRGSELYQKTAGVIGLGRLGFIVAKMYQAFGMSVVAYDPFLTDEKQQEAVLHHITLLESLEQLAQNSDLVSLHVVYEKETENLLGADFFNEMKQNAVFINTSRGGIVDEDSLLEALKNKSIAGAALDVLCGEPKIDAKHILVKYAVAHQNLIITPHIGGNTMESFVKTEVFIAQKIKKYLET